MTYTNLNISDGQHQFKYVLEYIDDNNLDEGSRYINTENGIFFIDNKYENLVKKYNYWIGIENEHPQSEHIPELYNISSFNIYFPRYSVDTYEKNVKYVLSINTWVRGKYVYLGSWLLDRSECKAIETGPKTFFNDQYYEYTQFKTIDPYYFIYGDEWKEFRTDVCDSPLTPTNEGGSNLNVVFCPVEFVDGHWIKLTGYEESQSALLITSNIRDYLSCEIKTNTNNTVVSPRIDASIHFNQTYEQSDAGLKQYIEETYHILASDIETHFVCVVQDKENAYKYIEHKKPGFNQSDSFLKEEFEFKSWDEYKEGMIIKVLFMIVPKNNENEEEWIVLTSNELFLDQELFKFFVGQNPFHSVKLNDINMNEVNINAINKVFSQVIQLERPDDYKANIQKPIFIKVQNSSKITIHPAVTENIVINLDAYKNKVRVFTLKIKDQVFIEIGRISNGVIFKIVGPKLQFDEENSAEGTYYILDDEGVLVTTGNYTAVLS